MAGRTEIKVPILLYHALFEDGGNPEKYAISVGDFERHVKYLAQHGFRGISLADLSGMREIDGNGKYVIISFDDGCASDFAHAFPVLRKYGFPATFFVTVNRIGTPGYAEWSNLEEMACSGMSIQSHSLNHVFLSDLSDDRLVQELRESKERIEARLSRPVDYISLPGGFISRRVLRAAGKNGYAGVVTSCPGLNGRTDEPEQSVQFFKRFVITRTTSPEAFRSIVYGDAMYAYKQALLYKMKSSAKKTLGSRVYYALWSRFFKYRT